MISVLSRKVKKNRGNVAGTAENSANYIMNVTKTKTMSREDSQIANSTNNLKCIKQCLPRTFNSARKGKPGI